MKTWRNICLALLAVVVILTTAGPVLAAEPHEDPAKAPLVYDGISLFRYYSMTVSHILAIRPEQATGYLEKMPYANLPDTMDFLTSEFTSNMQAVGFGIQAIDRDIGTLRVMIEQSQIQATPQLIAGIMGEFYRTEVHLVRAEATLIPTGDVFHVFTVSERSNLRRAYNELVNNMAAIRGLLQLYRDMLTDLLKTIASAAAVDEILTPGYMLPGDVPGNVTDSDIAEMIAEILENITSAISETVISQRTLTKLTLEIDPAVQFVGEAVTLSGFLTTEDNLPLSGKEVRLLWDSAQAGKAVTDSVGFYEMQIRMPYLYIPEIRVQTAYFPQADDIGIYLSALSEEATLNVLYYDTIIELDLPEKAYPGRDFEFSGRISYAEPYSSVAGIERRLEIYLDNSLIGEVAAASLFSFRIPLDGNIQTGNHSLTVSTVEINRYNQGTASALISVTKAQPVMAVETPRFFLIPGTLELNGSVTSELGPVSEAEIDIIIGDSRATTRTLPDGTFTATLGKSAGFNLIGGQTMEIIVSPQSPWFDSLTVTRKITVVNMLTCGFFLLLLALLAFAGRKIKIRIPARLARETSQPEIAAETSPEPVYESSIVIPQELENASLEKQPEEPRSKVLAWYIGVIKSIQRFALVIVKPNQTLREFARSLQNIPNPVRDYLMDFTILIERMLYSRHDTTTDDVQHSERLSEQIEKALKK